MTEAGDNAAANGRELIRRARSATLATLTRPAGTDSGGAPYASLVTLATDGAGRLLFLLSGLADHTRNLAADARASLLIEEASRRGNPQTGPRVTLTGRVDPLNEAETGTARARFLARHPAASLYAGFGDFGFYRMTPDRCHFVGGFARARWIKASEILVPEPLATDIAKAEADILAHMNRDHADAIRLYAQALLGRRGADWKMAGCDADGCDLIHGEGEAARFARLTFPTRAREVADIRQFFVALAKEARNTPPLP